MAIPVIIGHVSKIELIKNWVFLGAHLGQNHNLSPQIYKKFLDLIRINCKICMAIIFELQNMYKNLI